MVRVRPTPRAEADLFGIWNTIAAENPAAADGIIRRLWHAMELASGQPMMGAPRPELSPTARNLTQGRYLAIYEPAVDGITVVAVVHGMRDPHRWLP